MAYSKYSINDQKCYNYFINKLSSRESKELAQGHSGYKQQHKPGSSLQHPRRIWKIPRWTSHWACERWQDEASSPSLSLPVLLLGELGESERGRLRLVGHSPGLTVPTLPLICFHWSCKHYYSSLSVLFEREKLKTILNVH